MLVGSSLRNTPFYILNIPSFLVVIYVGLKPHELSPFMLACLLVLSFWCRIQNSPSPSIVAPMPMAMVVVILEVKEFNWDAFVRTWHKLYGDKTLSSLAMVLSCRQEHDIILVPREKLG